MPNSDKPNHTFDLKELVTRHDAELHSFNQRLGGIEAAIVDIKKYLQNASQTPWSVIISGVSVLIVIAGLALAPIYAAISAQNEALANMHNDYIAHIRDGHPYRVEQKAAQNSKDIDSLGKKVSNLEKVVEDYQKRALAERAVQGIKIEVIERDLYGEEVDQLGGF